MALVLCGAAVFAATAGVPAGAQTVIDYTDGQTRNAGIFAPGPGGLTLNAGAGVNATDASAFAGATGEVVKTGAGRLKITARNDGTDAAGAGGWNWTSMRVAEGKLDFSNGVSGSSGIGHLTATIGKTIQIDAGATLVMDAYEQNNGRFAGAGTLAIGSGGQARSANIVGAMTSDMSGHIGAHIDASDTTSTATNRAPAGGSAIFYIIDGHRLNFSGTSSDVSIDLGTSGTLGNTIALNGAVLGEVRGRTGRNTSYVGLEALRLVKTNDTALIEGDSRVASFHSKGTIDLGNNKLTVFDDQPAASSGVVASAIGEAGTGVLKGGAGAVLRKTGQSKLTFNLGDASAFLGAVEVAGGEVTIAAPVLADDNTLTVTSEGGRTGRVNVTTNERVGAILGDAGQIDVASTKTLQVGGTATDRGSNTFAGVLSGAGNVEFLGTHDTTVLTGTSTLTGTMAVTAGKVVVKGTLPAAVTVGDGGTVSGNGTVGAVNVASGGTLSVSNTGGPLRTGNVTLAAGSTFEVQLDANVAVASDVISTTGTIALNGANLHLGNAGSTAVAPSLGFGIASTGGISGSFGQVTDDYAFFDAAVQYGTNSVSLQMNRNQVSLGSMAGTENQRAAAKGLDGLPVNDPLVVAVLGLSGTQAQTAYDDLSGEVHADVQGRSVQGAGRIGDAVLDHLGQITGEAAQSGGGDDLSISSQGTGIGTAPRFWGDVFAIGNRQSRNDGFAAASSGSFGFVGGRDLEPEGPWTLGVLFGASRTATSMSDRASDSTSDNAALGVYGTRSFGDFGVAFGVLHDIGRTDATRRVTVGGLNQTLRASYSTNTTLAFAEVNTKVATGFGNLTPFLRLTHARVNSGAFVETGGAAALTRASQTGTATFARLGVKGTANLSVAARPAVLSATLGYQEMVSGSFGNSLHGFAAGGSVFSVGAGAGAAEKVELDLGLTLALTETADINLTYVASRSSGVNNQEVGLDLKVSF